MHDELFEFTEKMGEVAAKTIPVADLAVGFDTAFLFLVFVELAGIVLMVFVRERDTGYSTEGEPVAAY